MAKDRFKSSPNHYAQFRGGIRLPHCLRILPPEPMKRKEIKRRTGGKTAVVPDHIVSAIRYDYDTNNVKPVALRVKYGVTASQLASFVYHNTRIHLPIAKLPEGVDPKGWLPKKESQDEESGNGCDAPCEGASQEPETQVHAQPVLRPSGGSGGDYSDCACWAYPVAISDCCFSSLVA